MKGEISVLIADDNYEFAGLLKEYMDQYEDIEVIGIAKDGLQAIEMIVSLKPDVVVLDIIMPNLDGLGVLERLSSMQIDFRPMYIMLTAIGQDVFVQRAVALGAEYYIIKPFDAEVLVKRIRQLYKEKYMSAFSNKPVVKNTDMINSSANVDRTYEIEVEVTNLMHEVGIPPHMAGYQYLREAIIQTVLNNKAFTSITKTLYPEVAKKFNTTAQKVERAIRNAIESAWSRGNPDTMDSLFGYTYNSSKGKPTNSECIAMMADRIRITMDIR
ncbi:MAG TPA: sporulation transcription factor Spo0A [Acetivibrio sp.]|nr:sporulation transcription factor Spo0A [Clostridium sp.]HOQ37354.1 sporulation transcription factor Spo0A [Acetivibrio sp.]HPT91363.1 sporulation transcription factor Spo0A [Acetivibrio sp.]HQA58735.1 sporulation transcription factor Spo0A [Acetivibrio sp.]